MAVNHFDLVGWLFDSELVKREFCVLFSVRVKEVMRQKWIFNGMWLQSVKNQETYLHKVMNTKS